jgi:hypothetical protein
MSARGEYVANRRETHMPLLFRPAEETFVVSGPREEWIKRCEQAFRTSRDFRSVEVSPTLFRLTAHYRRPPVWGELTVTLTPEGNDTTHMVARATALPKLYMLIFGPERRIVDEIAEAIR